MSKNCCILLIMAFSSLDSEYTESGFNPKNFNVIGFLMMSDGFSTICPLFRQAHHLVLIATQSQPLIKTTTNLSIQFTHTPILLFRLNLIEVALIMILNTHKDKIMRP